MKIQKLPAEAISKLESGLIITDVVQCVMELVSNSLDAEATGVAVRVDLKNYQIRVTDNGKGIGREDLELVGEKFMTSNYNSFHEVESAFPKYGFRGQALSSLKDMCKSLTIETKSEDDSPTFVKIFHSNKESEIIKATSGRDGTGTTVTVEDFMCKAPVRRKRINEMFDIEEIKNHLQHLSIIHFHVCFTLRNDNKGTIVLQTPQASSMLESISNIFGKTLAKSLKALYYKEREYEVTGFISLKPQIQNNLQLIYINQRIITKGLIHKFINNVIKEYIGKSILCKDSPTDQVFKCLRNCCFNIFIVKIQCPHSGYEFFTNLRKTTVEFRNWKDVLKCLHKAIKRAFREVLDLDRSSHVQDNDSNSDNDKDKCQGMFGTSVLVNAVKGAAVKRRLITKKDKKKKKKRILNKVQVTLDKPQIENYKKPVSERLSDLSQHQEISHDSLESPIPRKYLKRDKPNVAVRSPITFNKLSEFYSWIRTKLETDENAFNLYNDFLKIKNGMNHSVQATEITDFKSPVVGGKLKRKKVLGLKKPKEKQEMRQNRSNCLPVMDEEMAVVNSQQLRIFPSNHLGMKKSVQFTNDINFTKKKDFVENFNFDSVETKETSTLSVPMGQVNFNHSFSSLTSSEIQLTNIIKFRNWSETFLIQEPDGVNKDVAREYTYGSPVSATWESHYRDFASVNVDFGRARNIAAVPLYANDAIQRVDREESRNFQNVPVITGLDKTKSAVSANAEIPDKTTSPVVPVIRASDKTTTKKGTNVFQNVEIQVNLLKMASEKVNAMVQTSPADSFIQESPGFKSKNKITQGVCRVISKNAAIGQSEIINSNEEVPSPDFWNTSAQCCFDNNHEPSCNINEVVTRMPTPAFRIDKNSSSEFLCGQKSYSATKHQIEGSVSKDTQTLAVLWADSLKEIINTHTEADSNSKSESTVPKTIPIEEIENDIVGPIESEFCLTERHDFIPKGLSPSFFPSETNKTFLLSPREKCRIKVTVDNARNDLLAVVKWQDESTDVYWKPVVPEGILDEMRKKAKKNLTSFENPILSASLTYCAVKVHNLLHSFAFTKELLSSVEVLGQLDKKFIVTKMKLSNPRKMELISLFDQHAVDERIKLEELVKDYSFPDGKFIRSHLNSSVECVLNESDVQILSDLNEKLVNFGLNIIKINANTVSVNEIPTFLLNKHEKDLKNKKDIPLSNILKSLILNIIDELKETRGALSKIPKIMHSAFCLEACHRAIKFNRALSIEKMIEMIGKLKSCKLPFQCAHGRPSVIPIIDLQDFQPLMADNESIQLEKLKKFLASRGNKNEHSEDRKDQQSM